MSSHLEWQKEVSTWQRRCQELQDENTKLRNQWRKSEAEITKALKPHGLELWSDVCGQFYEVRPRTKPIAGEESRAL